MTRKTVSVWQKKFVLQVKISSGWVMNHLLNLLKIIPLVENGKCWLIWKHKIASELLPYLNKMVSGNILKGYGSVYLINMIHSGGKDITLWGARCPHLAKP